MADVQKFILIVLDRKRPPVQAPAREPVQAGIDTMIVGDALTVRLVRIGEVFL